MRAGVEGVQMMGRQASGQDRLFYSFNLEDHVPQSHLRILRLDRLWLRGPSGASDEFTLAAAVQNLRSLAKRIAHDPPLQGIGAPA
jgi:hypothetical protein